MKTNVEQEIRKAVKEYMTKGLFTDGYTSGMAMEAANHKMADIEQNIINDLLVIIKDEVSDVLNDLVAKDRGYLSEDKHEAKNHIFEMEEDKSVSSFIYPETVTGYVGQILDECEIDEQARGLLTELYNEALDALNEDNCEKDEKQGLDNVISAAEAKKNEINQSNEIKIMEHEI